MDSPGPEALAGIAKDASPGRDVRRILSIPVAVALAAAFIFPFLPSSFPPAAHLALRLCLVPLLAVLVLRQPIPKMALGRGHLRVLGLAIACVFLAVPLAAVRGFEYSYTHWGNASAIALCELAFILAVLRCAGSRESETAVSGGWLFLAAAVPLAVWPSGYGRDCDALCHGIMNFVFVGMTEELIFRGIIQGYLDAFWRQRWLGISAANWIASSLFAWIHNWTFSAEHLPWLLYLFPMGILFGVVRDRTGSWLASGLAHGLVMPILYFWATVGRVGP